MANIVQTDPVRIVFSVTDKEMLNLRQDYDKRGGEVYSKIILANGKVIKKADSFPFQRQLRSTPVPPLCRFIPNSKTRTTC